MLSYLAGIIIIGGLWAPSTGYAQKRNTLEELFIWKMSEELKLTAKEEKKFTVIVKQINRDKATLSKTLQDSVVRMSELPSTAAKAEQLKKYKKELQKYNHLSEREVEQLQELLGVSRTVEYLKLKQDLTNKVKSLLIDTPRQEKAKKLPEPKIIEEK